MTGIVTGEMTDDTKMMVSASGPAPPNMVIHIKAVTATGTLYSSTMPHTRLGLSPKKSDPKRKAASGMTTAEMKIATTSGSGLRMTSRTWWNVLLSAPWNVMNAKSTVTAGLMTEICAGNATPSATQTGTMNCMCDAMVFPSLVQVCMGLFSGTSRRAHRFCSCGNRV